MNIILIILLLLIMAILVWALFGKEESVVRKEKPENPDLLLRRRASDKEIEKIYPDEKTLFRRKSDVEALDEVHESNEDLRLPYSTDEIISETSSFRVYRRTLVNAEIYAKKGDIATAISLYEGVNNRINDIETNNKINTDIDYLKKYHELQLEKRKREKISTGSSKKSSEIKFSVDGPFSLPEKIQIGLNPSIQPVIDINAIAREITRKLKDEKIIDGERTHDIERYRSEINRLEKKVDHLNEALEVEKQPSAIHAKYQTPIPLIIDPKPIIDILNKIPGNRSLEEKIEKGSAPAGQKSALTGSTGQGSTQAEQKIISHLTDESTAGLEGWEVLGNPDEPQDSIETLSDADIFEKILAEGSKKPKDDYEILGDNRKEDEYVSYEDKEFTLKQQEEQKFYEKFLKHHKRKAKELPILKVSYDFTKLPDVFSLAKEKNILEYSYYKYKPMLERANEFIKKRKVKDAINYYKVVIGQNIPPEFKIMIRKNIADLTEYLEKYLSSD